MSQQSNKVIKRQRRARYLQRKKDAVKTKRAPRTHAPASAVPASPAAAPAPPAPPPPPAAPA